MSIKEEGQEAKSMNMDEFIIDFNLLKKAKLSLGALISSLIGAVAAVTLIVTFTTKIDYRLDSIEKSIHGLSSIRSEIQLIKDDTSRDVAKINTSLSEKIQAINIEIAEIRGRLK